MNKTNLDQKFPYIDSHSNYRTKSKLNTEYITTSPDSDLIKIKIPPLTTKSNLKSNDSK